MFTLANPDPSPAEFTEAFRLRPTATTLALNWVPYVAHADRAALEARRRAEGIASAGITERLSLAMTGLRSARPRPFYFPVANTEPFHAGTIGIDGNGLPSTAAVIKEVVRTRRPVVLGVLLSQRGPDVFTVWYPEFKVGAAPGAGAASLRGIVIAVVNHARFSDLALGPLGTQIDLAITRADGSLLVGTEGADDLVAAASVAGPRIAIVQLSAPVADYTLVLRARVVHGRRPEASPGAAARPRQRSEHRAGHCRLAVQP